MAKTNLMLYLPHDNLSEKIWENEDKMLPEVREALMKIADEFIDYLGIDLDVLDITMTGSLANYNYTPFSDIDLHIMIDTSSVNKDIDLVEEFFNAKKKFWNDRHDITIRDSEVELYPQDINLESVTTGVYSVQEDKWLLKPKRFKDEFDKESVDKKSSVLKKEIQIAINNSRKDMDTEPIDKMLKKLKKFRQSGLEKSGELADENITYKIIRDTGLLQKLFDEKYNIEDKSLSI